MIEREPGGPTSNLHAEDDVIEAAPPRGLVADRYLTGLVGRDILVSRSPWLHEQEADGQNVRLIYTLFDFTARGWGGDDLPRVLDAAEYLGFSGLNITYPFKQAVIDHLDDLSDGARRIGAVNTVAFQNGKRIGHNTDVIGFADSMRAGLGDASTARVVQCGAGGAGSATAYALLENGTEQLTLFDFDADKRDSLITQLQRDFPAATITVGTDLPAAMAGADGVVNATPMGTPKMPGSPVPAGLIEPRHWVSDIVYFTLETQLLADARAKGCRTVNGSGMVVSQAASAFEIFTGLSANRARMAASFDAWPGAGQ
ncbi:MAG: shikimate dehydrogenase [Sphingopyxis sp.]